MPGALVLGANTTDVIDAGSVTAFNNMTTFTCIGYFYPTTLTSTRVLCSKRLPNSANGWNVSVNASTSNIGLTWGRATTNMSYVTSSGPLVVNEWVGVCVVWDTTAAPIVYTFKNGVLTTATFSTTTMGSGAFGDDSARNFRVGNTGDIPAFPQSWQGRAGPFSLYPSVKLTSAEALSWFQRPRTLASTCRFWRFGVDGTTTQQDYSGSGNTMTATGATVGDGPPLGLQVPRQGIRLISGRAA